MITVYLVALEALWMMSDESKDLLPTYQPLVWSQLGNICKKAPQSFFVVVPDLDGSPIANPHYKSWIQQTISILGSEQISFLKWTELPDEWFSDSLEVIFFGESKLMASRPIPSHWKILDRLKDQDFTPIEFADFADSILRSKRHASVHRQTKETDVKVSITLEGTGKSEIKTGIGFFDHMLDQIARHAQIDLQVQVTGDLHIDEHHTIEDVALTFGEALKNALDDKKGLERYGFFLPMDDCFAYVTMDLGGRPWLIWKAVFQREKIGEMPTEMFMHFFKSLSDAAGCNLYIEAEGQNEHHKIESIFKGFAKALRMAIQRNESGLIPSSKGVL